MNKIIKKNNLMEFCISSGSYRAKTSKQKKLFGLFKNKDKNIFKNVKDLECEMINKSISRIHNCFFEKNKKKNIIKFFINKENYDKEVKIYLYLIDKQITPLASPFLNKIEYETYNKMSLFSYLNKYKCNKKLLINELFCFISKFQRMNFIHGNLHIHNIFIDENDFINKGRFYIIDFTNSYIVDKNTNIESLSYFTNISVNSIPKFQNDFIYYWDFFTIYLSLNIYLNGDLEHLKYIDKLIQNYVPKEKLVIYLNMFSNVM